MAPGTQARLICEWPDIVVGETVNVIKYDPTQGYLVRTSTTLDEIWLPAHVLSATHRKHWSFRFRKPSFAGQGRRSIDVNAFPETIAEISCPEFRDKIKDITAQRGSRIGFKCRVKVSGRNVHISWRKTEPDPCVMRNSGR